MTSERWLRVKEIYHDACDLAPAECSAFLAEACGADRELQCEVESLLAEDGSRAGILDQPSGSVAAAGKQFGPYRIEASIGKGGMGEVWKARDSRLNRDVAIKISAQQFTGRFEREARAIAALNHPHVCQIYDVGPDYIVMEFVDGTPLKGPMPVDKALALAIQLASALDAAHRGGVTHRDLKPANVLLTKSGVKVLDFGLAKLAEPMTPAPDDPTVQAPVTATGMVMGTPPYMSPEQVMARPADARSDIFAFGCVLYELLTGRKAFEGATTAAVICAVLERDAPSVTHINKDALALDRVLQRCLAKDPDDRWQTARDLKAALELVGGAGPQPAAGLKTRPWLLWALTGACALGLAAVSFLHVRETPAQINPVRFILEPPEDNHYTNPYGAVSISPDGRYLVFGTQAGSAATHLWLRPVGSLEARMLSGTEGGNFPFWSPDSKSIAFFADNKLKRLDIAGGEPLVLCDTPLAAGGAWNEEGVILFAGNDGLHRVASSGGASTLLTKSGPAPHEFGHSEPQFLPGGKRFLYFIGSSEANIQGIYAGSLDRSLEKTRILATDHKAIYTPPHNGHRGALLWVREQTLMAQDFDAATLRLSDETAPVAENVAIPLGSSSGRAAFWASDAGLLVYRTGGIEKSRLFWMSREGKRLEEAAPEDKYGSLSLSPDGKRLAFSLFNSANKVDIWVYDLSRSVTTRLTFGPDERLPVWSPDGRFIAYGSTRNGATQLYRKNAGGSGKEEQLTSSPDAKAASQWSADGKYIVFIQNDPNTGNDIMALPVEPDASGKRAAFPLLQTAFDELGGVVSPDGKWLAYASNESGAYQVYIQAFPVAASKWQVSNGGDAVRPLWRGDGKEIFYERVTGNRTTLMAAGIGTGRQGVDVDSPRELFTGTSFSSGAVRPWLVTPDGQRFLIEERTDLAQIDPLTVVQNWQDTLKK